MFSVGVCVECGRPACGRHLEVVDGRTLCPEDAAKAQRKLREDEERRVADHLNQVRGWVRDFATARDADEVLRAVSALKPYTAIGRYKTRSRMEEMGLEPPDETSRRRAWSVLRKDISHPPQLELLKVGSGGFAGKPVVTGSPVPLWGYALYYWYKTTDLGELRHESTLVAISAEGDVYADVPRSGGRQGSSMINFRCERPPWTSVYGYIARAGDGLRRRQDAKDHAWLIARAPAPRAVSLRDLAEWATRGGAPANLLFSESADGRYAAEGFDYAQVKELAAHSSEGIGDWY